MARRFAGWLLLLRRTAYAARVAAAVAALTLVSGCVATPAASGVSTSRSPVQGSLSRDSWRFQIRTTTDSTVNFGAEDATWIKRGMSGIVVDPARGDTLVATLVILDSGPLEYSALITGQVRPVTRSHVVILGYRKPPLYRRRDFWAGVVSGAAAVGLLVIGAR